MILITHMLPNGKLLRRVMSPAKGREYLDVLENEQPDWILCQCVSVDTMLSDMLETCWG